MQPGYCDSFLFLRYLSNPINVEKDLMIYLGLIFTS